jgi:hypothetical protein
MLSPLHLHGLAEERGIALDIIKERGYHSADQPADLIDLTFNKAQAKMAPALVIPLWNVHGQRAGWQMRPDYPRQFTDGKVGKYELPKGGHLILDVHPRVQPLLGNPGEDLWITEGIPKGDALVSHGVCTIALQGVWGFRGTNEHGGKVILPDWDYVALNGRTVYVVFDSDIYHKPDVDRALKALYTFLRSKAAIPRLVHWPEEYRTKKWGVDDFLAAGHTLEDLLTMVPPQGPLPPRPPRFPRNGASRPMTDTRPTIQITPQVAEVVDAAITALQALPQAPLVYQRARELCIIGRNGSPPKWLRRQADTPLIQIASAAHLWELVTTAAQWKKYDVRSDEWRHATPPRWVPEVIQGRSAWPFPMLEGVICCPTLRPDGSMLDTPGYDGATGLFLDFNGTTFPTLLPHPTLDDARSALGRLHEVFQDFPFATREPGELTNPFFSAAIAAVLTLVCRSAIHGNVPMFGVTATAAGSGKGKLVDAIALISTGRVAPKMGQTLDESEELKRLLALALEGASVCCIDNVAHPLGNQHLDLAITSQTIHGRILGQTGMAEAPWHAVMFATGNNLSYRGDMVRRVVPIALDPQMERPEERTDFRHPNLEEWVRSERPRLVIAALTIMRAYFVAGCPEQGLTPYGSFEGWSGLVRNALVWLSEADPCEGRKDLAAQTDENYERLAALLAAWEACFPHRPGQAIPERTINQVKQEIALYASAKDEVPNTWDELREALIPFDKRFDGKSLNSLRVGTAFRDIEGRVIGRKRLKRHGEYRHNALWRVETV